MDPSGRQQLTAKINLHEQDPGKTLSEPPKSSKTLAKLSKNLDQGRFPSAETRRGERFFFFFPAVGWRPLATADETRRDEPRRAETRRAETGRDETMEPVSFTK